MLQKKNKTDNVKWRPFVSPKENKKEEETPILNNLCGHWSTDF